MYGYIYIYRYTYSVTNNETFKEDDEDNSLDDERKKKNIKWVINFSLLARIYIKY